MRWTANRFGSMLVILIALMNMSGRAAYSQAQPETFPADIPSTNDAPNPYTWIGNLCAGSNLDALLKFDPSGKLIMLITSTLPGCVGLTSAGTPPANTSSSTDSSGTLAASATSLSFANVNIGSSSILSVTFTNAGNSDVTVSNVSISGAGFTASGVSTGQILTPAQTATLDMTFTPAAAASVSGSVTVTSNATNSPATISLSGTGVQPVSHSVTLDWTASTSTVAGYNVYRSTVSGGPYTELNSTVVTPTQYTDSAVQADQTYYYVATSVDSSNVESEYSSEISATIPTP